jgi:hypothetical protein
MPWSRPLHPCYSGPVQAFQILDKLFPRARGINLQQFGGCIFIRDRITDPMVGKRNKKSWESTSVVLRHYRTQTVLKRLNGTRERAWVSVFINLVPGMLGTRHDDVQHAVCLVEVPLMLGIRTTQPDLLLQNPSTVSNFVASEHSASLIPRAFKLVTNPSAPSCIMALAPC